MLQASQVGQLRQICEPLPVVRVCQRQNLKQQVRTSLKSHNVLKLNTQALGTVANFLIIKTQSFRMADSNMI